MPSQKGTVFPRKKIATRVKHRILQNYLKAWGGIIVTSNRGRPVRLAFVDTCCGSGLYAPNDVEPDAGYDVGSALIGIEVLSNLLAYGASVGGEVTAKALFINENAAELDTLRAAIAQHSHAPIPFQILSHRLEDVVEDVASFCHNHFTFLFIDPYGPSAIPFSVVSRLVQLKFADCLVNFPYYSIHKWVGWLDSGEQEARLAIVDALLNGAAWRDIARRHRHSRPALEEAILDHYMNQLAGLGLAAFALPMSFEDRKRTLYHLVFTSRNTAGLAAAKKELQDAEAYQAALKAELKAAKQHQGLLDFMAADAAPADPVDIESLACDIHAHFHARSVTVDDVIRYALFKPHVLDSHVRKAFTRLKKAGLAHTTGTRYHDTIKFAS